MTIGLLESKWCCSSSFPATLNEPDKLRATSRSRAHEPRLGSLPKRIIFSLAVVVVAVVVVASISVAPVVVWCYSVSQRLCCWLEEEEARCERAFAN